MPFQFYFPMTPGCRPEILRATHFQLRDRNFEFEYQRMDFHALHVHFYYGTIRTPDGDVPIQPGDITVTPAGYSTRYALTEPGTHFCVHFRLPEAAGGFPLPFHIPAALPGNEPAAMLRRIAQWQAEAARLGYREAAANELQNLFFVLFTATDGSRSGERGKIGEVTAELDRHLEQPLFVAEIARKHQWSQTHLERMFKRIHGCTISQYVMRGRIEKAQVLLETSDLSIKEIAILVGYANAQEFYKRYRQIRGHAPSQVRNSLPPFPVRIENKK